MIKINETKNGVTLRENNCIRIENVVLANNSQLSKEPYKGKFGTEYKAEFIINKSLEMGKINTLLEIVNEYERNQGIEELSKSDYSTEKNYNTLDCNSWYSRMNFIIRASKKGEEIEVKSPKTGAITKETKNLITFMDNGKSRLEASDFGVESVCHILVKMYGKTKVKFELLAVMHTGTTQAIERPFDDSVFDDLIDLEVDNKKSKNILSPF